MSRFRFLSLIALAMTLAAGVLSASASAANVQFEVETGKSFPQEYKGTSGLSSLLTAAATITCKKDKFTGKITGSGTASTTGTAAIDFEECSSSGFACNSPGDASGVILVNVNAIPVYITATGTLAGILFTPEVAGGNFVEINCTALVKVIVKGELICNYSPENTFVKAATIKCKEGTTANTSLYTKYSLVLPIVEKTVNQLLSEVNKAAGAPSGLVGEDAITSTNAIELKT